ncbi:MAG TPA: hypothetical protein VFW76_05165 [Ktedonobacterales bacterium]|nr:hypothetical protein [Ktedonobacterales bacterium]
MPPTKRRGRSLWLILPVLSIALAMWARGSTATITHQSATQLRLGITIIAQYTGNTDVVLFETTLFDNNRPVLPPDNAYLTCEGADATPGNQTAMRECPRQPAGGAYRIVYTDEHGVATSAVIPIPKGTVALLTPRPGDTLAIPVNNTLAIRYTAPVPPPNGSVTIDEMRAVCGEITSPPCGEVLFAPHTAEVARGGDSVFQLTGDFSSFRPGEGMVDMTVGTHTQASQSGFAGVDVTFTDSVAAPITWTR